MAENPEPNATNLLNESHTNNTQALNAQDLHIHAYNVKLPQFWTNAPEVYFEQVEATFRTARLTASKSKYDYLLQALPANVMSDMLDIIRKCRECDNPYDVMKKALIDRNTLSESARVEQLLSGVNMGDKTPSAFYRYLTNTAGSTTTVSEDLVKTLWMRRLPPQLEISLKPFNNDPIDTILRIADQVYEVQQRQPNLSALGREGDSRFSKLESELSQLKSMISKLSFPQASSTSSNNRSRSRSRSHNRVSESENSNVCFYHKRFGDKAKKCNGSPCPHANSKN